MPILKIQYPYENSIMLWHSIQTFKFQYPHKGASNFRDFFKILPLKSSKLKKFAKRIYSCQKMLSNGTNIKHIECVVEIIFKLLLKNIKKAILITARSSKSLRERLKNSGNMSHSVVLVENLHPAAY